MRRKIRGRHAAPDNMCTYTWRSEHPGMFGSSFTLSHRCVNGITDKAKRVCDGEHLCRDMKCPYPEYDPGNSR